MKKIGVVGGVGWLSTLEYYEGICRRSEQRHVDRNLAGLPSTPEMSIESLDLNKAFGFLGVDGEEASWSQFDAYHRRALQRLEASGADFALLASNTPHHRFASIVAGVQIPVLNLFEVVAREAARMGAREVLILGAAVTMRSPVFRREFARYQIEAYGPGAEDARSMTVELIADLQLGRQEGAAQRLTGIAKRSFEPRPSAQPVVCLACTELSLAFPDQKKSATFVYDNIVYINTTTVHINAAFDLAVSG